MEYISKSLQKIGVDINGVVSRLGGNEQLYLTICKKFLRDNNFQLLQKALLSNDFKEVEIRTHTLKGVAANLGFIQLEFLCKMLLDNLKNNEIKLIQNNIKSLSNEYYKIIDILEEGQIE
jgi:HPt (histidine-containing phosphotransfer) domain-containing protein